MVKTSMYALSEIDFHRFGVVTAKVLVNSSRDWHEIQIQGRHDGVELIILRVPAERLKLAQEIQRANAELMDILCYFEHRLGGNLDLAMDCPEGFRIRPATIDDTVSVKETVRSIFADYPNHYRNDERLERCAVDEVYPSWAESILTRLDGCILLVENKYGPVGISAMLPTDSEGIDIALFGIHSSFARQGLGGFLLGRSMQWSRVLGGNHLTYSTQLSNLPARRMVTRHGFLPTHDLLTFHLWL